MDYRSIPGRFHTIATWEISGVLLRVSPRASCERGGANVLFSVRSPVAFRRGDWEEVRNAARGIHTNGNSFFGEAIGGGFERTSLYPLVAAIPGQG